MWNCLAQYDTFFGEKKKKNSFLSMYIHFNIVNIEMKV